MSNNKKLNNSRVQGFDVVRATSILIIICYHFNSSFIPFNIKGFNSIFFNFSNGSWGSVGVTLFFMLSGSAILNKYYDRFDIYEFYEKRIRAIFPLFYASWILVAFYYFLKYGNIFEGIDYYKILYTFVGIDGYLSYLGKNYYLVGEWFLGAILFVYMLFPLLRFFYIKYTISTVIFLFIAFYINIIIDTFLVDDFCNIFTCLFSFLIGGVYYKYKFYEKKDLHVFSLLAVWYFTFNKIQINNILIILLYSFFVYHLLFISASLLFKNKILEFVITKISLYSYPMFLLHHVVIVQTMSFYNGSHLSFLHSSSILLFLITITVIFSITLVAFCASLRKAFCKVISFKIF